MIEPRDDLTLGKLSLTYRVLFTGFLLVIGLGLCMAGAQIMLTHGKADGKVGLSMDDIVYSYYGNRSGSKLESALTGKMKDKAPADVNFLLIKWALNRKFNSIIYSRYGLTPSFLEKSFGFFGFFVVIAQLYYRMNERRAIFLLNPCHLCVGIQSYLLITKSSYKGDVLLNGIIRWLFGA